MNGQPPTTAPHYEESGTYRHHKGGLYHLLLVAQLHDTPDLFVVYLPLGFNDTTWQLRRTDGESGWDAMVTWPDGVARRRYVPESTLQPDELARLEQLWTLQELRTERDD